MCVHSAIPHADELLSGFRGALLSSQSKSVAVNLTHHALGSTICAYQRQVTLCQFDGWRVCWQTWVETPVQSSTRTEVCQNCSKLFNSRGARPLEWMSCLVYPVFQCFARASGLERVQKSQTNSNRLKGIHLSRLSEQIAMIRRAASIYLLLFVLIFFSLTIILPKSDTLIWSNWNGSARCEFWFGFNYIFSP